MRYKPASQKHRKTSFYPDQLTEAKFINKSSGI